MDFLESAYLMMPKSPTMEGFAVNPQNLYLYVQINGHGRMI